MYSIGKFQTVVLSGSLTRLLLPIRRPYLNMPDARSGREHLADGDRSDHILGAENSTLWGALEFDDERA